MDIMDMNKLQVFSDSIEQELTAIEEIIPDDAEYTELQNVYWKLLQAWGSFALELDYMNVALHNKGE